MEVVESANKGRGVSWRRAEILNLLDIWGEQEIQDQLRSCHRNIDSYILISREMINRGHNRSAIECRTKAKSLRQEYRRVVEYNSQIGSNAVTCLYYNELHKILGGNAMLQTKRIAAVSMLPPPAEGSTELFSHDLATIDGQKCKATGEVIADPETVNMESAEGHVRTDQPHGSTSGSNISDGCVSGVQDTTHDSVVEKEPEPVLDPGHPNQKAHLSPATRLAMARNCRAGKAVSSNMEHVLRHATTENNRLLRRMDRDAESFDKYMHHLIEDDLHARKHREALLSSLDKQCALLETMVGKLGGSGEGQHVLATPDLPPAENPNLPCTSSGQHLHPAPGRAPSPNELPLLTFTPTKTIPECRRQTHLVKKTQKFSPS